MNRRTALGLTGATLGALALGSGSAAAGGSNDNGGGNGTRRYRITVANLTGGQPFTPPAVAAHDPSVEVFSVGEPANDPTKEIAENGNLEQLVELIEATDAIRGATVGEEPLVPASDPGDTGLSHYAILDLEADASATFFSFISMLIATNDGFCGLDTVPLPEHVNESRSYYAASYDAGTEENTEDLADIVPPAQELLGIASEKDGTAMSDPDLAEDGVVVPHPGLSGDGDLDSEAYGWHDPVALVQVERLD